MPELTQADIFQIEYGLTKLKLAIVTAKITGDDAAYSTEDWTQLKGALRYARFDARGYQWDYIVEEGQKIIDDWKAAHAHTPTS